ncbi:unnamed protein product, partial [Closterium sp. NIES-54]
VDPLPGAMPVEVVVDSGAARGATSGGAALVGAETASAEPGGAEPASAELGGAEPEGAELGGAESEGAESRGAEPEGAEPGGTEPEGAEPRGAESEGAESRGSKPRGTASAGGPAGASPRLSHRREILSSQQLCEWFAQRTRVRSGAAGAIGSAAGDNGAGGAGATSPGSARVTAGAGGTGGAGAAGPGGACTRGTRAAGASGVGGTGAGDPGAGGTGAGGAGAGDPGAGGTGVGGTGAGGNCAGGVGAGDLRAGGAGAGGAGAGGTGAGGTMQRRPFFVPPPPSSLPPSDSVLRHVLSLPSSTGLTPSLLCPQPHQSQPQLQPHSPLHTPSPYAEQTNSLTEHREPESRLASPVCAVCTGRSVPRPRPPPIPGTHIMALRPSCVPLRVPLPSPPASSVGGGSDPESDLVRAAGPTVTHLLANVITDPSFDLVAESESDCPPSIGGECALSTDVLEDRQEDFECLAAAVPHLMAMLLAPEGDPDAPDIPTPRSYAEAITAPYSSQWQIAMDAEMGSWMFTGTYVDAIPPPGANIVSGMWIFRVMRPPGSPPVFKARYVARGFSQRQGVDFFQNFSPTLKMTDLRVLLHVTAQCEYELHSLDFSTTFLQGSLHEEIWLRRPLGFTGSFPAGTQWSLRRPVYGLCQAPREWHDTRRTMLTALGFAPSTADPSLFLRTDTLLSPFYVLLVFATADTEALALLKSDL